MNSVTLDCLDLSVILSTFAACAVVGWFAACLMSRFEVVKPTEPAAPVANVRQIEVIVVDRGFGRRRRTAALFGHDSALISETPNRPAIKGSTT